MIDTSGFWALAAILAGASAFDAPAYCKYDECRKVEMVKASNLCRPTAGAAAAWVDNPFEPSVSGVSFYDIFSLDSLITRFGEPLKQTARTVSYPGLDPTGGEITEESAEFHRYEFQGVVVETATLSWGTPRVTQIDLTDSKIQLKCGLRLGILWSTFRKKLALPDPVEGELKTSPTCPIFYDLNNIEFDHGGGFMWGDNSTLCFYPDDKGRIVRILWDKTDWAIGGH